MDSKSQYGAWMLELANYFVKEHGYQVITISKNQAEMWLVNVENTKNPIMMITSEPIESLDEMLLLKHRQSLSMVFNVPAQGINLSVSQENDFTNEKNIAIGPDYVSDEAILRDYPRLKTVLKHSQNPERSLNKALNGLRRNLQKAQKQAQRKLLPVTSTIGTVLLVVFLISRILLTQGIKLDVTAVMLGAYYKRFMVDAHQYWRLITAGFVHIDFFHLMMNLIALRNLGTIMERVMGSKKFLFTLLAGIIFGNMFVFITDEAAVGLGISGGLFALMGAMIVYLYESGAFKNRRMLAQIGNILFINLFISMLPGISFMAHLGGFIAGILLGFVFSSRPDWLELRKYMTFLFVGMIVGLAILMTQRAYTEPDLVFDKTVIKAWKDIGLGRYADWLAHRLSL
ncbi:rhomboid family intramembrane serine protease [Erysipelothrix urinaevulpis]|uniref:rhomboid family intramembrane serine protease n=1 Tax=Erysipelothrix urinaevulpis TaxID=2683717 RepID=UPI00135B7A15|nr:rhomboid family intramembrane serine protease [Erysipelothrix urinaevulpis]